MLLLVHRSIPGTLAPRSVSGWCWVERCSPWPAPFFSPGSAEDRSSLFVWFIDTMVRSDSSRGLPVLVHVVSQRARVLRLRRTDCSLAIIANSRDAFLHQDRVGVLILRFSKLNSPAHQSLCLRFNRHLAMPPARLEARMDSLLSFPVGLFHPLQHAGLSRRTPRYRLSAN